MKLKIIIMSLVCSAAIGAADVYGQQIADSAAYRDNLMIYSRAMRYNDTDVAKMALYNLINMNPRKDSLLFSLSYLYFDTQNYISSILSAQDLLRINPDHQGALELSAVSYENIGALQKALESYESLYLKNNSINTLYKMGFLQYRLGRLEEAEATAEILLERNDLEETTLFFPVDNQQQEIPMKASVYNLMGLVYQEEGNAAEARRYFEMALEIAPEFQLAKDNLADLQE